MSCEPNQPVQQLNPHSEASLRQLGAILLDIAKPKVAGWQGDYAATRAKLMAEPNRG